jgi:hypothetical protein
MTRTMVKGHRGRCRKSRKRRKRRQEGSEKKRNGTVAGSVAGSGNWDLRLGGRLLLDMGWEI